MNKIFHKDKGSGDVILMLHGNPDTADYWDGLINHLSGAFRCIAVDLPGFGRSEISDNFEHSLSNYAVWMDEFMKSKNIIEPIHLIVHDVGAFFGLSWAIKYPDKVKSICVSNTLYFSDYRWHFWGRVWRTPLLGELANLFMSKWLYKMEMRRGGPLIKNVYLDRAYGYINARMKKTVLAIYRAMSPYVFKQWEDEYIALAKKKNVLVIWGDRDPFIPLRFGFAERFAQGQVCHHLADSGHWPTIEMPDEFNSLYADFLKLKVLT